MRYKILLGVFALLAAFVFAGSCGNVYAAEQSVQQEMTDNETIDAELMLDYTQSHAAQTKLLIVLVVGVGILVGSLCMYMFLSRLK